MPGCCHLTRREMLRWSALVATTPLVAKAYGDSPKASGPVIPMNLEIVTLTETSVIMTWFTGDPTKLDGLGRLEPVATEGEVQLGTAGGRLKTVYANSKKTPYHYAEITGLEPGQTYYYIAKSNGIPAIPAAFFAGNPVETSTLSGALAGPLVFKTPQPPQGKHLFSIALTNDLHIGEKTAGLVTSDLGGLPPGFEQLPGRPPYAEVMAKAMVVDAKARGANIVLAAGDLASEASSVDLHNARKILDGFGAYKLDYLVARGNHDRPHEGATVEACHAVEHHTQYHDCFRDTFFPAGVPTWFDHEAFGLRIIGLDTYDKLGKGSGTGYLSDAQVDFVRKTLSTNVDQPTMVFGHHPVTLEATASTLEPLLFDLDLQQSMQLQEMYAKTPGVFLHHSGHTHRNRRTLSPISTGVVFQEVGATKEYPGGFHLLRVHSGGYAMNFYKTRADLAREWSERTRGEDFNLVGAYVLGNTNDRNYVAKRDFSGLKAAR